MSVLLYEEALLPDAAPVFLRHDDGAVSLLPAARWCGSLDRVDEQVVARLDGPTIDIGCGPGRFVAGLAARGLPALGIDISASAIALARGRGAMALRRDVFGNVPGSGRWQWALLMDGNVGIGGAPSRLLTRVAQLVGPSGTILVEVEPVGGASGTRRVRLEGNNQVGAWFPWAWVTAEGVGPIAESAGLKVLDCWTAEGRSFAELTK